MNKNKLFAVLFAMLCLAVLTVSVFADQEGNNRWCNIDQYGCWVTDEDTGGQNYVMFWSEEARQYFMGDSTVPYKNVVDRCIDCEDGKLPLEAKYGYRRVSHRYYIDGLVFDTTEKFLDYLTEKGGWDSCAFDSNRVVRCK